MFGLESSSVLRNSLTPLCFFLFRNTTFHSNHGRKADIFHSHGSVSILSHANDSGAERATRPNERDRTEDARKTPHAQGAVPEKTLLPGFHAVLQEPHILLSSDSKGDLRDHCTQKSHAYFTQPSQMNSTLRDTQVENPDSLTIHSENECSSSGSSSSTEYIQPGEGSASETEDECALHRRPQVLRIEETKKMDSRGRRQTAVQKFVSCQSTSSLA